MIKFGPAGMDESFEKSGYKKNEDYPIYLKELGLSAYEYQCSRGVKISKEIQKIIYTTNPIESLNSALRKVTKGKGSFINKEALLKVLFLRIQGLEKKWCKGTMDFSTVKNQLQILFEDRISKYC